MMVIKCIRIKGRIYPTMQDTPAGQAELARIREFVSTVEEAAQRLLPNGRHSVIMREDREHDLR